MTQEEKAMAYDEALKRAKEINNEQKAQPFNIMLKVFPELAESEDERIRKALLEHIQLCTESIPDRDKFIAWLERQKVTDEEIIFRPVAGTDIRIAAKQALEKIDTGKKVVLAFNGAYIPVNGKTVGEIYSEYDAWLEKQGEQKPTDKVEPKFHKCDWIIHQGTENIYQVVAVIDNQYQLKYGNNYTVQNCADVDRCARLWDIAKDAKKGDVLVHNGCTFIFICIEKGVVQAIEENLYNGTKTSSFGEPDKDNDYSPATKEQRDLLFQKMKEAGYIFDFEKKELKKIEQKSTEY